VVPSKEDLTPRPAKGAVFPLGRRSGGHATAQMSEHLECDECLSGKKRYKVKPFPSTRTVPSPLTSPVVTS
jgi:hypothetical protein